MNASEQIIEVLEYLGKKIGFTIDWTADNVWPYIVTLCEKFINWEVATSWMWIGIMSALILISLAVAIIIANTHSWDGMEWLIFAFVCVIGFVVIGVQIHDIITCYTFPEKVIYDYIKNMIETGAYKS